jgi:hypothetical protein
MMPRHENSEVREVSWSHPLLRNILLKHVSSALNMHTTVNKLLKAVFSNQSVTKLYKDNWHTYFSNTYAKRKSPTTQSDEKENMVMVPAGPGTRLLAKPSAVYLKSKPFIASSKKMSEELEMDLEGIVCALIQVLSWYLPGGTKQNHKNPQNSWCCDQHAN